MAELLSPRAREIALAALGLLEAEGSEGLSMRRLAERLGIRAPSLYKHFGSKAELEAALIAIGFEESAAVFEAAIAGRGDRLARLADAYRSFARERPELYTLMTERPLPRELLPQGLEDRAAAPVGIVAGGDLALARALWAFAHGMTMLELNGRFPADADIDASWAAGVEAFRRTPQRPARRKGRAGRGEL